MFQNCFVYHGEILCLKSTVYSQLRLLRTPSGPQFRALNRARFYSEIIYSVVDCSVIYVTRYCPYFLQAARNTHW